MTQEEWKLAWDSDPKAAEKFGTIESFVKGVEEAGGKIEIPAGVCVPFYIPKGTGW